MVGRGNQFATRGEGSVRAPLASLGSGVRWRVSQDQREIQDKTPNVLPVIPASTQKQRTSKSSDCPKNPLALLASESRAMAARNNLQEQWRSALLEYEVALKELVTNSTDKPPSDSRLMKTFQLYDAVSRVVAEQSPELADMLKMFRIEFCRATLIKQSLNNFTPQQGADGVDDELEELGRTYFDQVEALLRENAALRMEVSLGNTRDKLAEMKAQIERLTEVSAYYENEVNLLGRENRCLAESYRKSQEELAMEKEKNIYLHDKFEDEKQRLLQENKDMQLRLCRLRKYLSDRESTIAKDSYKNFKDKKMSIMTRLFDEGDERVSVLVMLSQLESRVNEELDNYDRESLLSEEAALPEHQQRMLNTVSVLLEEMHLCEERYLRLVPRAHSLIGEERDETDSYITLLGDERLYEALVARTAVRKRRSLGFMESETEVTGEFSPVAGSPSSNDLQQNEIGIAVEDSGLPLLRPEAQEIGSQASVSQNVGSSARQLEPQKEIVTHEAKKKEKSGAEADAAEVTVEKGQKEVVRLAVPLSVGIRDAAAESLSIVRKKQEEWVDNIFGTAVNTTNLLKRVLKNSKSEGNQTDQERLMHDFISKPLLDVSSNKFQCGIDIFTGPGPLTQSFLCSVKHVDPVDPLPVPQGTNFMHVKYRNPLRVEAVDEDSEAAAAIVPNPEAIDEWGRKAYVREAMEPESSALNTGFQLFTELGRPSILKAAAAGVTVASSSTPATAVFERLNPLSPNRSPEWLLYQNLYGGYRPLTPRLIDMSYIDHILLNSCERHFDRCEERYMRCLKQARTRATNSQMALNMAERLFKDTYTLTDFQESVIRELESRYCYPELVAKSLYEILCFLDATKALHPLVDLYLSCIRGFESPSRIHYITYVLYQISVNWPSSNPEEPVLKEDVITLLEHIYKRASGVTSIDASDILTEYQMATRSAPITWASLRSYLVTAMLHFEDPLLLYFNGLLSYKATSSAVVEMNYEEFGSALKATWEEKVEGKLLIRYLTASCGFNKKAELTTKELACVAASMWSSHLWTNM
ncbi:hypothetical protein TraAM80_00583 [Trypanosoma rangeli]|uniref:Uncharacterized protein n=1 Tax=Trypanosoma rangeli TaxID=5698 RepID=A0A422P2S7_TRYRA|nr:uncharacterized protein TraAM80_00583 [Trypanosoma rangeli]RNF12023.1 hypothetical protein TraAM80_00583 [Trypanosoma rangeli]|eukprot:RNF12023.1 hypothetical protein TraAM80_00583 [Trypanosoma rangeli]